MTHQPHASRAELLAEVPARVRLMSAEPLLGPLDLTEAFEDGYESGGPGGWVPLPSPIHWVIVGGESGPEQKDPRKARPMDPAWARSLRDQCYRYGVAFHFKQWGGVTPKSGGRLLDGREWNEFPDAEAHA